jgi:hypothetical protein
MTEVEQWRIDNDCWARRRCEDVSIRSTIHNFMFNSCTAEFFNTKEWHGLAIVHSSLQVGKHSIVKYQRNKNNNQKDGWAAPSFGD